VLGGGLEVVRGEAAVLGALGEKLVVLDDLEGDADDGGESAHRDEAGAAGEGGGEGVEVGLGGVKGEPGGECRGGGFEAIGNGGEGELGVGEGGEEEGELVLGWGERDGGGCGGRGEHCGGNVR